MFSMDTERKVDGPSELAEMLCRYRNPLWRRGEGGAETAGRTDP